MLKSECFEAHYHSWGWEIFPTDAYYEGMASFNICLSPQSEEEVQRTIKKGQHLWGIYPPWLEYRVMMFCSLC